MKTLRHGYADMRNSLQELGCLSITFAWRPQPGPNLSVSGTTSSWHLETSENRTLEGNKKRENKRIIFDHLWSSLHLQCPTVDFMVCRFLASFPPSRTNHSGTIQEATLNCRTVVCSGQRWISQKQTPKTKRSDLKCLINSGTFKTLF